MRSLSIMVAFDVELKLLNNFVRKLISFRPAKKQKMFFPEIFHRRQHRLECCSLYELSRAHSQFVPRSLKAERVDSRVGLNAHPDGCGQTEETGSKTSPLCSKKLSRLQAQERKPSLRSSMAAVAEPTDAHDSHYCWIKCFITPDLMGWNPLLSVNGLLFLTLKCIIKASSSFIITLSIQCFS